MVIIDSAYLFFGNKIIYNEKIGKELKFKNIETITFENEKIIKEMKNKNLKLFVKIIYSKGNKKQEIKKGINENLYLKVGKIKIK